MNDHARLTRLVQRHALKLREDPRVKAKHAEFAAGIARVMREMDPLEGPPVVDEEGVKAVGAFELVERLWKIWTDAGTQEDGSAQVIGELSKLMEWKTLNDEQEKSFREYQKRKGHRK
jgi:hypothetical protein